MSTRIQPRTHRPWPALMCAAVIAITPAARSQQNPMPPVPSPHSSSSKATTLGAALLIGGALVAWWSDKRVDKAVKDVEDMFRDAHTDSNGDVTTTQKNRDGKVLEREKVDKNGVEKDYDQYRWEGEVCVYEQHMERKRNGGHVHHVIFRNKAGKVIDDETNEFDKDGHHIAGTHTTVDGDGKSTTKTYDQDTNTWK